MKFGKKLQNQKLSERTLIEHKLCTLDKSNSITYLEKFISEMERVCVKDGIIILNTQENIPGDDFSENVINSPEPIIKMFKKIIIAAIVLELMILRLDSIDSFLAIIIGF